MKRTNKSAYEEAALLRDTMIANDPSLHRELNRLAESLFEKAYTLKIRYSDFTDETTLAVLRRLLEK